LSPRAFSGCRIAAITLPAVCWKIAFALERSVSFRHDSRRHDSRDVLSLSVAHHS
jgi:hypothetical protein